MLQTTISQYRDEAIDLYRQTNSFREAAKILCERHPELPGHNHVRSLMAAEYKSLFGDDDVYDEHEKLRKQKQKAQDKLRLDRKVTRDGDRRDNAIEELLENITDNLKTVGKNLKSPQRYSGPFKKKGSVMVVHLSDLHLQELVTLESNKYDFVIASKRLQLMAQKAKALGDCFDCHRIVLAIGGDVVNSDRRIDELLSAASNRSRAVVLAVHLLRQFILDLRERFYIDVVGVCGNEGRAKQELAWSAVAATDSYDALVYYFLQNMLEGDKGLRFNDLQANESVFTIHNETFLLIHGHQARMTDQKAIQSIMGKFANRGIKITHVIAGHIHSACISDYSSRNSSLVGSNAYSEAALNFISKASQNIHIVHQNGLDGFKADLQDTTGVPGYNVMTELQRHNARTIESMPTPDTMVAPIQIT